MYFIFHLDTLKCIFTFQGKLDIIILVSFSIIKVFFGLLWIAIVIELEIQKVLRLFRYRTSQFCIMSTIRESKIENNIFVRLYFEGILLLLFAYKVLEICLLEDVKFYRCREIYIHMFRSGYLPRGLGLSVLSSKTASTSTGNLVLQLETFSGILLKGL